LAAKEESVSAGRVLSVPFQSFPQQCPYYNCGYGFVPRGAWPKSTGMPDRAEFLKSRKKNLLLAQFAQPNSWR